MWLRRSGFRRLRGFVGLGFIRVWLRNGWLGGWSFYKLGGFGALVSSVPVC